MEAKDIKRVSSALMTLEVAVRTITNEDLSELMAIKDSGRHIGVEQLPSHIFKNTQEGLTILNALATFKWSVKDIESYKERPLGG